VVTLTPEDLDAVVRRLRAAGCVYAEDEADLLIGEALDATALATMIDRRVQGEPLEQIVGWAEFLGLRLRVRPGVFVPRRRTELLARVAVEECRPGQVLVDLCCGVGAVAAAVAARVPGLSVYASDLDPDAVAAARENLGDAGRVLAGDLFAPLPSELRGRVAMITANAPYVPTAEIALMPTEARDHEHRIALDGGPDGLDLHRRIIAAAADWLMPGGRLAIETSRAQADTDLALLRAAGLTAESIIDDDIDATVVLGRRPS
jgi:release factor glutamine methyltransferase